MTFLQINKEGKKHIFSSTKKIFPVSVTFKTNTKRLTYWRTAHNFCAGKKSRTKKVCWSAACHFFIFLFLKKDNFHKPLANPNGKADYLSQKYFTSWLSICMGRAGRLWSNDLNHTDIIIIEHDDPLISKHTCWMTHLNTTVQRQISWATPLTELLWIMGNNNLLWYILLYRGLCVSVPGGAECSENAAAVCRWTAERSRHVSYSAAIQRNSDPTQLNLTWDSPGILE